MKKKIYLTLVFLMVTIFSSTAEDIHIGLLLGMTGERDSEFNTEFAEGITGCFDYINNHGGINGNKIFPILKDTQFNADKAAVEYEKLKKENIKILYCAGADESMKLQALVNTDKIILFTDFYDFS